MKTVNKILLIVDLPSLDRAYKDLTLFFGKDCVLVPKSKAELYADLRGEPDAVVIEPGLLPLLRISPEETKSLREQSGCPWITVYPRASEGRIGSGAYLSGADAEFAGMIDYFDVGRRIRALRCPEPRRRERQRTETEAQIRTILTDCGFRPKYLGLTYLTEALVLLYMNPALHKFGGAKKIYCALAKRHGTTPRIVERAILRLLGASAAPEITDRLSKALELPPYCTETVNFIDFSRSFIAGYVRRYGSAKENRGDRRFSRSHPDGNEDR